MNYCKSSHQNLTWFQDQTEGAWDQQGVKTMASKLLNNPVKETFKTIPLKRMARCSRNVKALKSQCGFARCLESQVILCSCSQIMQCLLARKLFQDLNLDISSLSQQQDHGLLEIYEAWSKASGSIYHFIWTLKLNIHMLKYARTRNSKWVSAPDVLCDLGTVAILRETSVPFDQAPCT